MRQLRLYLAYHLSGAEQQARGVFPRVLWLAPDERRVEVIADSVQQLRAADRELFQVALFSQALTAIQATDAAE